MRIITIVGARPQFVKAAVVSRAIAAHNQSSRAGGGEILEEFIIHTGQHFDSSMSDVFFEELNIPRPNLNLGIQALSHGAMTGRMIEEIEKVLSERQPDWVLVYGDTNSTLAGALAAAKQSVPVVHVEAGLRSHNRHMPEEINRVVTDSLSSLLFCPTSQAVQNLRLEGFNQVAQIIDDTETPSLSIGLNPFKPWVVNIGDVMYDALNYYKEKARDQSTILDDLDLQTRNYLLATIHRAENTDHPKRLKGLCAGLKSLASLYPVVMPLHPRTRSALTRQGLLDDLARSIQLIEPVGYLDMVNLEDNSRLIITDSGGVQKEAYFCNVPCVTVRRETEWVELLEIGCNRLVEPQAEAMLAAIQDALAAQISWPKEDKPYGQGNAGEKICSILIQSKASAGT
jgi:UDP-GlcNAc3NAcA epimerase